MNNNTIVTKSFCLSLLLLLACTAEAAPRPARPPAPRGPASTLTLSVNILGEVINKMNMNHEEFDGACSAPGGLVSLSFEDSAGTRLNFPNVATCTCSSPIDPLSGSQTCMGTWSNLTGSGNSVDLSGLAEGNVKVIATLTYNSSTGLAERNILKDTIGPELLISSPLDGSAVEYGFKMTGTCGEPYRAIEIYYDTGFDFYELARTICTAEHKFSVNVPFGGGAPADLIVFHQDLYLNYTTLIFRINSI